MGTKKRSPDARCVKCGSYLRAKANGEYTYWCVICDVLKPKRQGEDATNER